MQHPTDRTTGFHALNPLSSAPEISGLLRAFLPTPGQIANRAPLRQRRILLTAMTFRLAS